MIQGQPANSRKAGSIKLCARFFWIACARVHKRCSSRLCATTTQPHACDYSVWSDACLKALIQPLGLQPLGQDSRL